MFPVLGLRARVPDADTEAAKAAEVSARMHREAFKHHPMLRKLSVGV